MEKEKLFYHYIYQKMISCINYFYKKENLRKMGLNERQIKSVIYVKEKGAIKTQKKLINQKIIKKSIIAKYFPILLKKYLYKL